MYIVSVDNLVFDNLLGDSSVEKTTSPTLNIP